MKRLLGVFMSVLLALLCLTGCGGNKGVTLSVDLSGTPGNLDPQQVVDSAGRTIIMNTFTGLMGYYDGKLTTAGAKSYTVSEDQKTYTFVLEQSTWRNNKASTHKDYMERAVTAHDYVFAFRRIFSTETRSPYTQTFACLSSSSGTATLSESTVVAQDDYTLVFRLTYADDLFLQNLTLPGAMPCNQEFFESTSGEYGMTQDMLLYNGDYALTRWDKEGGQMTLYKTVSAKEYRSVSLSLKKSYSDRVKDYEDKKSDILVRLSDGSSSSSSLPTYQTTTWSLVFNIGDTRLFSDESLRRAFLWSTDLSPLSSSGGLTLADGLVPPAVALGSAPYRENHKLSFPLFQPDTARSYLGDKDPSVLSQLTLLIPNDIGIESSLESVMQIWQRELRIYPRIEKLSTADLQEKLESGEFDFAVIPIQSTQNSPYSSLSYFDDIAEVAAMLIEAQSTGSIPQKEAIYAKCEQFLVDHAYCLPLYYSNQEVLMSENGEKYIDYLPFEDVYIFN